MKACVSAILLILSVCHALSGCVRCSQTSNDRHSNSVTMKAYQHGTKIDYRDGKAKVLPDISVRFLEERKQANPNMPFLGNVYDFEVSQGDEKKKVMWSSGTGDIGPTFFEIGGEGYVLELQHSDGPEGRMKQGEMIIWKRAAYDKMLSEQRH